MTILFQLNRSKEKWSIFQVEYTFGGLIFNTYKYYEQIANEGI